MAAAAYKVSGGLHGVGASVVNALSVWLEVEVYTGGHKYFQRFERGKQVTELQDLGPSENPNRTGTTVRFLADPEIFKETTIYNFETLQTRLREQAFLNAGIHIELTDLRGEEPVQHNFCYQGGVFQFCRIYQQKESG